MQFLQVVQNSFDSLGLSPKRERFNRLTVGLLIWGFVGVCWEFIFIFYEANSSQERMESIYIQTGCAGTLLSYATTIIMKTELFVFINNFDELTNESKLFEVQ